MAMFRAGLLLPIIDLLENESPIIIEQVTFFQKFQQLFQIFQQKNLKNKIGCFITFKFVI